MKWKLTSGCEWKSVEDLDWKVGFKGKEGQGWQSLMIRGRDEEIRGEGAGVLRQASDKVYSTVMQSVL